MGNCAGVTPSATDGMGSQQSMAAMSLAGGIAKSNNNLSPAEKKKAAQEKMELRKLTSGIKLEAVVYLKLDGIDQTYSLKYKMKYGDGNESGATFEHHEKHVEGSIFKTDALVFDYLFHDETQNVSDLVFS